MVVALDFAFSDHPHLHQQRHATKTSFNPPLPQEPPRKNSTKTPADMATDMGGLRMQIISVSTTSRYAATL